MAQSSKHLSSLCHQGAAPEQLPFFPQAFPQGGVQLQSGAREAIPFWKAIPFYTGRVLQNGYSEPIRTHSPVLFRTSAD